MSRPRERQPPEKTPQGETTGAEPGEHHGTCEHRTWVVRVVRLGSSGSWWPVNATSRMCTSEPGVQTQSGGFLLPQVTFMVRSVASQMVVPDAAVSWLYHVLKTAQVRAG